MGAPDDIVRSSRQVTSFCSPCISSHIVPSILLSLCHILLRILRIVLHSNRSDQAVTWYTVSMMYLVLAFLTAASGLSALMGS